jgi:hypothetical protein
MAFNHFVVAAHTPMTGSPEGKRPWGWPSLSDNVKDLSQRLKKANELLNNMHGADLASEDTWAIFLAPEWFFKKSNGFYSAVELGKIIVAIREESTKYPKMLMVPGTILWAMPGPVVYNTVLVLCGGDIVHIYHKTREGLDIDRNDPAHRFGMELPMPEGDEWRDRLRQEFGAGKVTLTNIFAFQDRICGIEVCADHSSGILLEEYLSKTKAKMRDTVGVDLHILISCGMDLKATRVATRKNGYALHCEGNLQDNNENKAAGARIAKVVGFDSKKDYSTNPPGTKKQPRLQFFNDDRKWDPQPFGVSPFFDRLVIFKSKYSL